MFHHFHGQGHYKGQGSISQDDFIQILDSPLSGQILSANHWLDKLNENQLEENQVCLTFDDNLLCQYDIAFEILEKRGLKAIFFIYTSIYEDHWVKLELIRRFRETCFNSFEYFLSELIDRIHQLDIVKDLDSQLDPIKLKGYLSQFTFYSDVDRQYRYLRDELLGSDKLHQIIWEWMDEFDANKNKWAQETWMSKDLILDLHQKGHIIGLHSHSHPTRISKLSYKNQFEEYKKNSDWIYKITGTRPEHIAHPVNSYNSDTLKILKSMNIKTTFLSNMTDPADPPFLINREDHSNILKKLA